MRIISAAALVTLAVRASHFDVQLLGNRRKCYSEDLAASTLVIVEVEPRDNAMISVEVSLRSPFEVYYQEQSQRLMKTAFTMQTNGVLDVCLDNQESKNAVSYAGLRLLTGTLAKDFSSIATKEHLDPVIKELQTVESILAEFNIRQRILVGNEASTRELVDLTHRRVVNLAIANVAVVVACNILMAFILKAFFKSKKII